MPSSYLHIGSIDDDDAMMIVSPSDFINEYCTQKVYAINNKRYKELKKLNSSGVPIKDSEETIIQNSTVCINTLCINMNSQWEEYTNYHLFSQIFAGSGSPPIDDDVDFVPYHCPSLGLTIYYAIKHSREVEKFTPLHTSFVDHQFQAKVITNQDVNLAINALSTGGSFPNRNGGKGHNSYMGMKTNESESTPTPTEGPQMRENYTLFRATTDPIYLPSALHLMSRLASCIFLATTIFYHPLAFLRDATGALTYTLCRIAILTINYSNVSHVDTGDRYSSVATHDILNRAKRIMSSPLAIKSNKERLGNYIKHVEEFGASVHTTCGIQFPKTDEGMRHPEAKIVVCQVFLMLGLGMSIRMCNFMTHIFLGGLYQHCTCVPIVIVDGMVYFGKHPYINIVNWGEGTPDTPEVRARKKAAREKRKEERKRKAERQKQNRDREHGG